MLIVTLKESDSNEKRVSITPEIAKKYLEEGYTVSIESGAGLEAGYSDDLYEKIGVNVEKKSQLLLEKADVLLSVGPPHGDSIQYLKSKVVLIGMLKPYHSEDLINHLLKSSITSFSLELLPRTTRAQIMDVLSSQSNLAGYKAVVEAASILKRALPLMMTAAGTIPAAKVLVLGAGVAGLQAIATAKRLGAIVSAFDVRSTVKEQVESLGATFIHVEANEKGDATGGYAKEMSENYKKAQANKLGQVLRNQDIVITTAQIPGKPAPILITDEMIEEMKSGSVIVDLAAETGGNCSGTIAGQTVIKNHVTIIGPNNILSGLASDASRLYSRNVFNFIKNLFKDGPSQISWQDDITIATAVTHEGKLLHSLTN